MLKAIIKLLQCFHQQSYAVNTEFSCLEDCLKKTVIKNAVLKLNYYFFIKLLYLGL